VVEKEMRILKLMRGGQTLRSYRTALGKEPKGPKRCQGDLRTPEGTYIVDGRNSSSRYHRALHISYPNSTDIEAAKTIGCDPGGEIMIHGLPNGYGWVGARHVVHDWTQGCIAVTDEEIEEIWRLVPNGIAIEIKP
jgi:murein L,D-transpeptidase YafK